MLDFLHVIGPLNLCNNLWHPQMGLGHHSLPPKGPHLHLLHTRQHRYQHLICVWKVLGANEMIF